MYSKRWLIGAATAKYGLTFCLLGLVLCTMPAIGWYSKVPGDLVDSRFNNALLEHLYLWVRGEADELWSPDFFYPYKGVLTYSDNHFGSGPFYVLFRFVGFDRIAAYQTWFALGSTLNFAAAYYVFRKLSFSDLAAAAGAFAFAFALSNLSHHGHSQLVFRFAIPLAFLFLWQGLERGSPLRIAIAAALTAYQFLCSIYLGIFLIYLLGFVALFAIVFRWSTVRGLLQGIKGQSTKDNVWTVLLFVLSALSTAMLLYTYFRISSEYGFNRSIIEVVNLLPRVQSYFVADGSSIWRALSLQIGTDLPNRYEHQMFFGLALIVAAIGGFWVARRSKSSRHLADVAGASLLALILFTLYIGPYSPYMIFMRIVPGVDSIRAVARIDLLMVLPLAILCAVLIDQLRQSPKAATRHASLAIACVLLVEPWSHQPHAFPVEAWKAREHAVDAVFPEEYPEDAVLYLRTAINSPWSYMETELDGVFAAQKRGLKTINGYSGNVPPGHVQPDSCLNFDSRYKVPENLRREDAPSNEVISERLLIVELQPCPNKGQILDGPIDFDLIQTIDLSLRKGERPDQFIVAIRNTGPQDLPTVSPDARDIKLSWRVVDPGLSPYEGNWDPRQDVMQIIRKDEALEVPITLKPSLIDALENGGELQVSLVQEAVIWFHDRGLDIGTYRIGD